MRVALGVEFDGSAYFGWQRQKDVDSVQARLEHALSFVANEPIRVHCAGRTDAGVHATAQVVHFDTKAIRKEHAWILGGNVNLPDDIAIRWAKEVSDNFHARFAAIGRRYRYIIYNHQFRPGIFGKGVSHYSGILDESKMHQAAQYLLGEQDFTSFRALHCQAKSPIRRIDKIEVTRQGDYIFVDIKANAFLHHMVRNIVGSLLAIGYGHQSTDWIKTLLTLKDRSKAGATAKPNGLYLVEVNYDTDFEIPEVEPGPLFIQI